MTDDLDSDRTLIDRALAGLRSLFQPDEDDRPEYDEGYLDELKYRHITTDVTIDGGTYVRCDLCAALFEDMNDCLDHVTIHGDQVTETMNPFRTPTGEDELVTTPHDDQMREREREQFLRDLR